MRLAKAGRSQAAEELGSADGPSEDRGAAEPYSTAQAADRFDAEPAAPGPSDEIVPKLARGEFDEWVDDVAREMLERTSEFAEWYRLSEQERDRWRKLAKLAVLSVKAATVHRTLARIRALRRVGPIDDLAGREDAAGLRRVDEPGRL